MKSRRARRSTTSGKINFGLTPLTAAVLTALYSSSPVLAQEQEVSEEELREEVIVTGTLIRREDTYNSASPVDLITTDIAVERGITDLATLLQTATVAQGSPQRMDAYFRSTVLRRDVPRQAPADPAPALVPALASPPQPLETPQK